MALDKFNAEYYRYYWNALQEIADLYGTTYDEVAHLVYSAHLPNEKRFAFRGNKRLSESTDSILKELAGATTAAIAAGTSYTWGLSNTKNDELTRAFLHDRAVPERYMNHNADKLAALQKRKIDGLTVSSRVWRYTETLKTDLEMAIDVALREGTSAAELSRSIRRSLNNPDALFRRVRNQYGNLVLSKNAAAFHPGQGVYRSAYQNAIRLAGTEVNMAYREADLLRWNQQDFVLGYEVKTSLRKLTVCPLCEALAGVYPKSFVWTSWHPRCRCYATPVLAKEGEFIDWLNNGGTANFSGQVTDTPPQFKKWVANNTDSILRAEGRGKLPYFLRDNQYKPYTTGASVSYLGKGETTLQSIDAIKDASLKDVPSIAQNIRNAEAKLGIKKGTEMTFEAANALFGNVNYRPVGEYSVNCQSCVVANELRRRGFNVTAQPLFDKKGSIPYELARNTRLAWVDPATGKTPEKIIAGGFRIVKNGRIAAKSFADMQKELMSMTQETGRYHIGFVWKGERAGHIITMEKLPTGMYRFYDPQNGQKVVWKELAPKIKLINGIQVLRVDNLLLNTDIIDGIVKAL